MGNHLDRISDKDFIEIINKCEPYFGKSYDKEKIFNSSKELISFFKNKIAPCDENIVIALQDRWYASLSVSPDYSVYNDHAYLAEVWACWKLFSRNSVRDLVKNDSLFTKSVVSEIGDHGTVCDLGCGLGLTTLGLKEIFPASRVVATQLKESFQYKYSEELLKENKIEVFEDTKSLGRIRVFFASEYFEHFERPVEHLVEILNLNNPEFLIIANGFGGIAIGHFHHYKHLGSNKIPAKEMSRFFNETLRKFNYTKLKTKIWNNRPNIWKKIK